MRIPTKLTASLTAILLLLAMTPSALATTNSNVTESTSNGATTEVKLTVTAPTFKVTVPTTLNISIGANGTISCADNVTIENGSIAAVKVTKAVITPASGWSLVAFDSDSSGTVTGKVNSKTLGLQLTLGKISVTTSNSTTGTETTPNWVIDKDAKPALTYAANLSAQSAAISSATTIASVVFTVAWDTATTSS
jgi:hypothetical protein